MFDTAASSRPLEGLVVVDLTRYLPGPYCTRLLADLGAEVVKIEDPAGGDPARALPPYVDGVGVYFRLLNHGKRSVALDLRRAEGREALQAVLASADACVHGYRPETACGIGVDAAAVRTRHPRLVHCSISGYGQDGTDVELPGHDLNYQAEAGLLTLDDPPRMPALLIADITGALRAALAVVAALAGRGRTGEGAAIDVSLRDAAASWFPFAGAERLSGEHACYNIYETADGRWAALGALEPKFWARFCRQVGREDWIALQFAADPDRTRLLHDVRALFSTRSASDWASDLVPVSCCFSLLKPGRSDGVVPSDVPALGADTAAVLRDAGVAPAAIAALLAANR